MQELYILVSEIVFYFVVVIITFFVASVLPFDGRKIF